MGGPFFIPFFYLVSHVFFIALLLCLILSCIWMLDMSRALILPFPMDFQKTAPRAQSTNAGHS